MPLTRRQAISALAALSLPVPPSLAQTSPSPATGPATPPAPPPPSTPLADLPPDLPNFHGLMEQIARDHTPALSYLDAKWTSLDEWKAAARPKFLDLLSYQPKALPVGADLVRRENRDGFTIEVLNLHATPAHTLPARVLIPKNRSGRLPAVVAMHCHSGRYTWGHEKILSHPDDSSTLTEFRNNIYGRPWAEALVQRGYIVIVIDAFYFGARRLRVEDIPANRIIGNVGENAAIARTAKVDSPEWILATNRACSFYEHHTAKTIFATGATWPGLHAWDDQRTVDYLLTRADVDPDRIGVIGLSGGGFRTALLIASDPRIKAACIAGWMTEFAKQLKHHVRHTWMVWLPGLYRQLDLPDAVMLHAPGALLVQQCRKDTLYPLAALESSVDKLTRLSAKAGLSEKFRGTFYDLPHSFRPEMQEEAFAWMDKWL